MIASAKPETTTSVATEPTPGKSQRTSQRQDYGQSKYSRWATITVLSIFTYAVFVLDFTLLGKSGDGHDGLLGDCWVNQLLSFARSRNYFNLDLFISFTLLGLIGVQVARWKVGKSETEWTTTGAQSKRALTSKDGKPGNQQRCSRSSPDASCRTSGVSNARAASATQSSIMSRLNQSIDVAARAGDAAKAGRILLDFERQVKDTQGESNRPDTVSYNLVLRACAKQSDFKLAEYWLTRMESKGVEATVCSYNTVLDACAKADKAEKSESWLQRMLSKGIEANVISYATVIYAWARRGEEALARAWLQKMIDAGVAPDAVSYNSMIHACGVCGNAAGAEHWIEEMQARGLEATVTTYTAVIDACAKAVDVPRAEKWLEAMIAAKVEPNVVSFSSMIDACAKKADPARAEYWHDRMVKCGIKPNAHSFSAVINACAKAGNVDMATDWLGRSEMAGVANDVVVYSSVIDACGKVGDAQRAMSTFRRMQANGIRPHIVAYAALARPFAYKGDWMGVEGIAMEMAGAGIKPNEYFLYAQLLSYATATPRQHQRAERCFRDALRSGMKANDHVVGALQRAVGRERCIDLMQELCDGRPLPNTPPRRQRPSGGNSRK